MFFVFCCAKYFLSPASNRKPRYLLLIMDDPKVPQRLKEARKHLGMSQREIAEAIGCSTTAWEGYEKGSNLPGFKILRGISKLDISLDWLVSGDGDMQLGQGSADLTPAPREIVWNVAYFLAKQSHLIDVDPNNFADAFTQSVDFLSAPNIDDDERATVINLSARRLQRSAQGE